MVLVTYPRPPLKALGIVCGNAKGEISEKSNEEAINVFVPTSPNPTTGFLLMVAKKRPGVSGYVRGRRIENDYFLWHGEGRA